MADLHHRGVPGGLPGGGGKLLEDLVGQRAVVQQTVVDDRVENLAVRAGHRVGPRHAQVLLGGEAHQVTGDHVLDAGQGGEVRSGGGQAQPVRRGDEHAGRGIGPEFLINAALGEMLPARPGQAEHTVLRHLWLSPDEAHALAARLRAEADEPHTADSPRGEPYGLLVSLYPADIPSLPQLDGGAPEDAPKSDAAD